MRTLAEHLGQVDRTSPQALAFNEHIRACERCFRATARGELCPSGVPLFDALPPIPPRISEPGGPGSYGFEGLDDSMTFPSQGSAAPRSRETR